MGNKRFKCIILISLFLIALMQSLSIPANGLDYGKDTDLSNVSASFLGEHWYQRSGRLVAGAGDINGDGFDDFLISSTDDSDAGEDAGKTFILFGKASTWGMNVPLLNVADATFLGESEEDHSGISIAGAGDVNGDGYDDFLIGAVKYNGGTNAGQTYLILGKASGWAKDKKLSNADASFIGEDAFDCAGCEVAGAGDVNGDGYDDILIGAPSDDDGGFDSGQTYILFGKASGWTMDMDLSNADASFWGESSKDESSSSIAGAGDVNGDGYDDILIGAPHNTSSGWDTGKTYLIFGKASGWAMDTNLSNADASFWGEGAKAFSATSIAGTGDVNGDGYDDILISSLWDDDGGLDSGQTYIIFGKASGWTKNMNLSNADASFWGENENDGSGRSVAGAGDVNGDGFDDILISTINNDDGGSGAGQTYLILGKASGWTMDTNLSLADASFWGENAGDGAGSSIAGAGDINGDGYDDLLIGSWRNSEGGTEAGQTYLIFPDSNQGPKVINSIKAFSDISFSYEISAALIHDTVFIELTGTDENIARKDIALVNVASNVSSPKGIQLRLMETGVNTGIYRGNFTITNRTHDDNRLIKSAIGETIIVTSVKNPSKNATIRVGLLLYPSNDNILAQEDAQYTSYYWTLNYPNVQWAFTTNASWLEWNATTFNLSGIPRNNNVGSFWVNLSLSARMSLYDFHNFTITVNNTSPEIITTNIETTPEDAEYRTDYNSTDDDQGVVTWHLSTDAGAWLTINPNTGVLSGIPTNDNVGIHYVNVSVDDGNGGWDWSNFSLKVANTNDRPIINITDNITAYENMLYSVQYMANEIDIGDILSWQLATNASIWLSIRKSTGLLSGIPENEDVGIYWVNVSVKDAIQTGDFHNFTLIVINTNDPPVISSDPLTDATAQSEYRYDVNAEDIDIGDVLLYSLDTKPAGMAIDGVTGLINWTPTREQIGTHPVVVNVSDGDAFVLQSFNVTVAGLANYPPIVTLLLPVNGSTVEVITPILTWSVDDPDSDDILYDVYLGTSEMDVAATKTTTRVAQAIAITDFMPSAPLARGTIYFWTIIPDDGSTKGTCPSGTWWFKVSDAAVEDHRPVFVSPPVTIAVAGKTYTYNVQATDEDSGDIPVFSLEQKPDGMTIDTTTGTITWIPRMDQIGVHYVMIKVSDGLLFSFQRFEISVVLTLPPNHKPTISTMPDQELWVGKALKYQIIANDTDIGDRFTFSLLEGPSGMTISSTGLLTWIPTEDQIGDHYVTVMVSDGKDNATVTFNVIVVEQEGKDDLILRAIGWPIWVAIGTAILIILAIVGFALVRKRIVQKSEMEDKTARDPIIPKKDTRTQKATPVVKAHTIKKQKAVETSKNKKASSPPKRKTSRNKKGAPKAKE